MTATDLIRVLIAESNAIFRQGLHAILAAEADMQVVGQAANAREAVTAFQELHPDVTIMDLRLPEMDQGHSWGESSGADRHSDGL
jgi:DNA-binding NarL/FixJ family response regulator